MSSNGLVAEFKGMNRQSDISNMSPKYLYDIYNGYIDKQGTIKNRFGYSKKYSTAFGSSADGIAQFEAIYDDGSSDFFVCTATKIFRYNAAGPSWVELKEHSSSVDYVSIVQYGDNVVFSDGVNNTQIFTKGDSTTSDITMPAGVTSFKLIHVHENRLWGISDDYIPYYSALGDIEDWTTSGDAGAGYLNLLAYITKGDVITAISTFSKAYLCFFMKDHTIIYSIGTVASEFQIIQTIWGTGTKSAEGIVSFGNDLYYLDNDSPKSLIASTTSQDLDVNDFVKGIMGNYYRDLIYAVDNNRISITKFHKRSWLIIHIPIGDAGEILIWDYAYQLWSGRWRIYDKINSIIEDKDGDILILSTDYVYKLDSTSLTDDGEDIEYVVMTPFYYGKDPMAYERITYLELLASTETAGTTLEISCYFGFEASPSSYELITLASNASYWDVALWDSALWDASGEGISRMRILGRGKLHRLVFRNAQNNKDVTIKYWKTQIKSLGYN